MNIFAYAKIQRIIIIPIVISQSNNTNSNFASAK